ncbi:posphoenolpyruvate synthetase regulatory kinase/phosphorylase PpsR [Thiobacter aerophilum]|uniref:Putative phosphoenolpyruvate synthase regulatory protein n=1 Tax=Thiobacter aerophilum TaxID=3121275 RepID=A0ABV0EAS9_9BURK
MSMSVRRVFFVSDHTGITVETLGRGLLSQFDHIEFVRETLPFVDDASKVEAALARITAAAAEDGVRPVVISSLADPALRDRLARAPALVMDVFDRFLPPLQAELGTPPAGAVGRLHGVGGAYGSRIDAVNFALAHDDGLGQRLHQADVVLIGVSRCGKTPTCLYLALQYGLYAANVPLTAEDFERGRLPSALDVVRAKLFGLSIRPERLHQIREERRPGSSYAALATCQREVQAAEALFRRLDIPYLDSTNMSVEEIASSLVHRQGLRPRL